MVPSVVTFCFALGWLIYATLALTPIVKGGSTISFLGLRYKREERRLTFFAAIFAHLFISLCVIIALVLRFL